MERRFAVHAGSHRKALTFVASLVLAVSSASAAPKDKDARRMFDKGVAAYTKGDYTVAAAALSESYAREGDPETLFAWAQAERKLGHCSNAVELYNTLLAFDLPDENKKVIESQLAECKQILKDQPAADSKASGLRPPASGQEKKEPEKKEPEKKPEPEKKEVAQAEPSEPSGPEAGGPTPEAHKDEVRKDDEARPWWKDPVGDALVIGGVVGLGFGTAMMISAHSADADKSTATTYSQYKNDLNTAHDRGMYGVVGLVAGGALVAGGIAWYATHGNHDSSPVTGWLAPTGGGVAVGGRF